MKIKIHTIIANIAKWSKKEVRTWLILINILTKSINCPQTKFLEFSRFSLISLRYLLIPWVFQVFQVCLNPEYILVDHNLDIIQKQIFMTFYLDCWSRDILNFDFFIKGSGSSFSTIYSVRVFQKNISHVICSISWPNFIVWLPLHVWDNGQYMYCNYFLSSLRRHKFWK